MVGDFLEVKGLKKYFPIKKGLLTKAEQIKAVDGINFSVEEGETFALVGESGCGKTTTCKVILRLEQPTAGSIRFHDQDVFELRGKQLHKYCSSVQAVFQDPFASLSPRMRVGAIVAEPLVASQVARRADVKRMVEQALAQTGLDSQMSQLFPHEFSGGQRQRIAVARALITRPSLVVLDEPVSALDVSMQAQIMNLLKDLQSQLGLSYLLIAHNLGTVRYMSQHVGIMYLGKIVEQGSADEVFDHRCHPYTQVLFSSALPDHPDSVKEDAILLGEVPSALNPPSGCRFHPRCSLARPICREVEPKLKEMASGHYVACHLY